MYLHTYKGRQNLSWPRCVKSLELDLTVCIYRYRMMFCAYNTPHGTFQTTRRMTSCNHVVIEFNKWALPSRARACLAVVTNHRADRTRSSIVRSRTRRSLASSARGPHKRSKSYTLAFFKHVDVFLDISARPSIRSDWAI